MAYFFGFFGISFLDTNAMERSPSSFGLSHLDGHLYASSNQRQGAGFAEASGKGGEIDPGGETAIAITTKRFDHTRQDTYLFIFGGG